MPDPGAVAHTPVVPRRVAQRSAQRVEVTYYLPSAQVRCRIRVSRQTGGVERSYLIRGPLPELLPIDRADWLRIRRHLAGVLATGELRSTPAHPARIPRHKIELGHHFIRQY